MNINWKVRVKNPAFWLALIPALLLTAQVVLAPFGITWDYTQLNEQLIAIVNAVFGVLAILGVVVDMTTEGFGDSERALAYEEPYPKHAKDEGDD